jgi:hypothetical protein
MAIHPTMISAWKQQLMKRAVELFACGDKALTVDDTQKVIVDLHRKIGRPQIEREFIAGQSAISRLGERRTMITPKAAPSGHVAHCRCRGVDN